jgi:hypothetical protein
VKWKILTAVCLAAACSAQTRYEIGGAIGYGIYRSVRINSPNGEASVGVQNRFAAGGVFCEDLYEHFSGEVRYTYQDGDPFLTFGSQRGNIQGQSHALSYNVLLHAFPREARFRPFAAAGVGAKEYRTTGPEPVPQPAPQIADIVHQSQWRWLVTVGGGVKYRVAEHVIVRGDFLDYITPFPTKLFVPTTNGTDRGIFHQFTPTFGLSYSF